MKHIKKQFVHTFHIPVMGTGFTIDIPLHVARYGISSAISLVDDVLIEHMRKLHSHKAGVPYNEISEDVEDKRALRITAYLNLLNMLIEKQVKELKASPFEPGSEITRYYEMLPDSSLKQAYNDMLNLTDASLKADAQARLRKSVVPGSIDVNIMTKINHNQDALSALRGFANSELQSSIIFSAGINPQLYKYISQFKDFYPDHDGVSKKKIILKVSDYRSALIQGKFLAKMGLWVSEFRVESGLNCGGHTFATKGHLIGPILEEFKENKSKLIEELKNICLKALATRNINIAGICEDIMITMQGGIGTFDEDNFLLTHYQLDGTGWATPFLLVPEVSTVDDENLTKLLASTSDEVYLSDSSPFGVPFWNLATSASNIARRNNNKEEKFGSSCIKEKGYLKYNTEFTNTPICPGSNEYLNEKLEQLSKQDMTIEQKALVKDSLIAKTCLCKELSDVAMMKHNLIKDGTPTICCGPNIVNFSKIATLKEMLDHIYGKISLISNPERLHMFVQEFNLYIEYLYKEINKKSLNLSNNPREYFHDFTQNLIVGYKYYQELARSYIGGTPEMFYEQLNSLRPLLNKLINKVDALFPIKGYLLEPVTG